ncbi:MAG: hypothetical protein ACYSVY_28910 [Planctomycetota bacterium]|jgi:hypothetical protein
MEKERLTRERYRVCDVCPDEDSSANHVCRICHRDLCRHHAELAGEQGREAYCERCWKVGEPFRKAIHQAIDDVFKKKVELLQEWATVSLKAADAEA